MKPSTLRLGAQLPDLESLGAQSFADLIGDTGELEGESRAEIVSERPGVRLLRVPLPGTPDAGGRVVGRPRGAGTGHVFLRRFEGGSLRELWRARFTHPRSTSHAAREWNLFCHLRSKGVGTPEPLAVAELESALFARRSVLVTRELEHMLPLSSWLDAHPGEERRDALARALELTFERMFEARVWLPELELCDVFATVGEGDPCAARQIAELRGAAPPDPSPVAGMSVSSCPEIAIASVRGGRILREVPRAARERLLAEFRAHRAFS